LHSPAVNPTTQSLVPVPAGRVAGAVGFLDDIIGQLLAATGVPGLAASVVYQGQLLYAKGFGVRDIDTGVPVDAETVFHLASVSKSLSSTVVAGLVGRKAVQWADPIVVHLPDFASSVPYVTDNVSYGDMFSHVSGLPNHAGDLLEDLGYDQQYILHALRLRLRPPQVGRAEHQPWSRSPVHKARMPESRRETVRFPRFEPSLREVEGAGAPGRDAAIDASHY
jgi:CubicO group peptidase (beta-lactamase class C family)